MNTVAADKILEKIDRRRVEETCLSFESFSDYERRILQAYLTEMNKGARYLPMGTLIAMGIKQEKNRNIQKLRGKCNDDNLKPKAERQ